MAKVRVYELAAELGVESKVILNALGDMGEFVRSASSTIEAPVVGRLRAQVARKGWPDANYPCRVNPSEPSTPGRGGPPHARPQRQPTFPAVDPLAQAIARVDQFNPAPKPKSRRQQQRDREADERRRWAELWFEPSEIATWKAAGIYEPAVADRARQAGITPGDCRTSVDGVRAGERLANGESGASVASRLRELRARDACS